MSGIGSLLNVGGCGMAGGVPDLEKAPDFIRNLERAAMPFFVPKMTGREMYFEAFLSMLRCCAYLGHSVSIWFLVSMERLSQGQVIGSGEWGMKDCLNSPV